MYLVFRSVYELEAYGLKQYMKSFGCTKLVCIPQGVTVIAGQVVSMIFHAWAVVVMLNMLVAMMSHSFDRVRNNAEQEWKFHRSVMWMKFIRKGIYPRPPPMNLIPSTRDIKSFYNSIKVRRLTR